jgi:putative membrane protein
MNPAMVVAWTTGANLIGLGEFLYTGWLIRKLALVAGLTGIHSLLFICVNSFAADRNCHPEIFYRVLNEIPTMLMVGIVILVIVRP